MYYTMELKYAVAALNHLSAADGVVRLGTIAKAEGMSLHYLEQIFRRLRRSGLVKAHRGPGGGYTIVSKDTTIASVVKALSRQASVREEKLPNGERIRRVDSIFKQLDAKIVDESLGILISSI